MSVAVDEDLSQEQRVARMSPEKRQMILDGLDMEELMWDWGWSGRPSQILPVRDSRQSLAVIMAGRGFGKTRTGSEWIREMDREWPTMGRDHGHMRFCLLGRTSGDVRDVMLEGPSGLLNIYPPSLRDRCVWTPSRRRVQLPNGSVGLCFSSEEPDQLRGPAFHTSWCDELAAFKQVRAVDGEATAWQNLRIATRLGTLPQILATTTPKRVPVVKEILAEFEKDPAKVLLRRGSTFANKKLSQAYLDVLVGLYGGTSLGRQELEGEVLDDVVGAMTTEAIVQQFRITKTPETIPWIRIIGVDPSVAEKPHDECGIVVVYISKTYPILRRHAVVVDDLSLQASPATWADVVLKAAWEHQATVVVETNQGGNVVTTMLQQAASAKGQPVPQIRESWSSKAKAVRAEPVGGAYAKGRVHHLNVLPQLEDQITSWVAGESGYSPDRQDALVNACAAGLFPSALIHGAPGTSVIRSAASEHLTIGRALAS